MSDLSIFNFGGARLRITTIDGEPWFALVDVCGVLDIGNPSAVAARLDEDELTLISSEGGAGRVNYVSEAGLFAVILGSRKPEAREFKRWVTHEVLPAIRRTGSYALAPALPQSYAEALRELATAVEVRDALAHAVGELTPRAEAWDELASAEGDYSVADAAKMLARAGVETGPQRLFEQLAEIGWIFRAGDGKWRAYAGAVDTGYLAHRPQSHHHPRTGELVVDPPQVRVTIRGLERLRIRLGTFAEAS